MNLVGIINENEFYTNHYLSEIFEGDIKNQIANWQTQESDSDSYKTPFRSLKGLGAEYFSMVKELQHSKSDTQKQLEQSRIFYRHFLDVLGYEYAQQSQELDELSISLFAKVNKSDGSPYLWIVESFCHEPCDVLTTTVVQEQLSELDSFNNELNYDAIVTSHIFTLNEPPRWVMLVSPYQIVLVERAKYAQKRFLRFDTEEIMARKEDKVLKAFSVLLHRESLAPTDGLSLLDTLDENSHKHAFGVTEDLKYSLRGAVELMGNEAIYAHLKEKSNFLETPNLEADLTREALRYMYRLLFLFYIESRPELGFIPSKSTAFLKGYSLESLRDLELMPLLTEADGDGYFFDESIRLYFDMIYNGAKQHKVNLNGKDIFAISPLRSHLFDPSRTPLLNKVKLRNHVWQEIIASLSLSRPKKGKGRGRISYANLGINQLGAVYEALLSYRGFIATETLYEVKKAGTTPTELENAYFVTESQLGEYKEEERVFEGNSPKLYPKGRFIYRLAGRDREKSASYYTPEVLTQSLVKYALKELLEIDEKGNIGKSADTILKLTVCEPAMGSAAFINEAINQLSEAYLHQKQLELGEKIPHDQYTAELQKVKMRIADNNVYGVDLNPTAVELAEISIWLNALSGAFVPWFGFQLEHGNSLIGARREVYGVHQLIKDKKSLLWHEDAPKRLTPNKSLKLIKKRTPSEKPKHAKFEMFEKPKQTKLDFDTPKVTKSAGREIEKEVYHFLIADKGMALYKDKVVKSLKTEAIAKIEKWRREFTKPYNQDEVALLLKLSLAIDKLWQEHTRHLHEMKDKTSDKLYVWGEPKAEQQQSNIAYKDTVFRQEKLSKEVKSSSPYQRLKLVMDYWCGLWFWQIEKAELLPTRSEYLEDISRIVLKQESTSVIDFDKPLFAEDIDDEARQKQLEFGLVDIEELVAENLRLQTVQTIAQAQKFMHWELEFADIFAKNGGFDLILGNPPWLLVRWEENGIMGEVNPIFDIRKFSASKLNSLRKDTFEQYPNLEKEYIDEYIGATATQNFLGSSSNYPFIAGKTNLYKCFLPVGWKIANKRGVSGFLHPEGVYDDPKGGRLRREIYKRLKYHFQFKNEKSLFQEVMHTRKYSINIFSNNNNEINFKTISNLFLPQTIDLCFNEVLNNQKVEGIKDDNNDWSIKGHPNRIITVNKNTLEIFSSLYDEKSTPYMEARLPSIHSIELLNGLIIFQKYPTRLSDFQKKYHSTQFWNEVNAQDEYIIAKSTSFQEKIDNLILQGAHTFVANMFYKTPKEICNKHLDYISLDLTYIPNDYIPRSNYKPIETNFLKNIPTIYLDEKEYKITDFFRIASSKMVDSSSERTFQSFIMAKNVSHINGIISFLFKSSDDLMKMAIFTTSIIADFYVKSTGTSNILNSTVELMPLIKINNFMKSRTLSLNSLTTHYQELYEEQFKEAFKTDNWTKPNDPRLNQNFFKNLTPHWQREVALRTDYERRQALVEIDVLVAQELELTLEELKTIYRIQFPVLKQNENETFYDINGRIVFTVSKGLIGVGLPRKAKKSDKPYKIVIDGEVVEEKPLGWEDIETMQKGEIHRTILDDTLPTGAVERTIVYVAPFEKCDREEDYEVAWGVFEEEKR